MTDFARERHHRPQHLAERRAVVAGDPFAERQHFLGQHRLAVEQPQRVARASLGCLIVRAQNNAGEFPRAERHEQPAPGPYAVPQSFRQRIGERPVKRNRQADIAVRRQGGVHILGNSGFRAGYNARYIWCPRAYTAAWAGSGAVESTSRIVALHASGTDAYAPVPTCASSAAPYADPSCVSRTTTRLLKMSASNCRQNGLFAPPPDARTDFTATPNSSMMSRQSFWL